MRLKGKPKLRPAKKREASSTQAMQPAPGTYRGTQSRSSVQQPQTLRKARPVDKMIERKKRNPAKHHTKA